MIAKNFIRSFSFWSQGTPIYFQYSKKGILNLFSSEFFVSLADEQETYITRITKEDLPRLQFQIL